MFHNFLFAYWVLYTSVVINIASKIFHFSLVSSANNNTYNEHDLTVKFLGLIQSRLQLKCVLLRPHGSNPQPPRRRDSMSKRSRAHTLAQSHSESMSSERLASLLQHSNSTFDLLII